MSALASRATPVFGAAAGERTSLKRPRGVVAVAPAACGKMAREPARRVGSSEPAQKRARSCFGAKTREGFGVGKVSVVTAPAPRHLKERMEKEHDAVLGLLKKAVHLSRDADKTGAASAGKDGAQLSVAERRPDAPSFDAAAKRRKTAPSKPAPQPAHQRAEPEKRPLAVNQRAATATMQRSMSSLIDEARKVLERRRLEEIARARERFRMELLEVEKVAMPDETIYPEDLAELGITAFQYAVTPTRKQAQLRLG